MNVLRRSTIVLQLLGRSSNGERLAAVEQRLPSTRMCKCAEELLHPVQSPTCSELVESNCMAITSNQPCWSRIVGRVVFMNSHTLPHQSSSCEPDHLAEATDHPHELDIDLSSLEHSHMSLFEAFRIAQPPLTEALRVLFQHFQHSLNFRPPSEEIRNRLRKESRQSFAEDGPWDVFVIFEVLLKIQGMFLDACDITNYNEREDLKKELKVVYVARNWFAGHGSCQHSDINGALIALETVLLKMVNIPACPAHLQTELQKAAADVRQLYVRSNLRESNVSIVPLHSISFVLVLRALERVCEFKRSECVVETKSDAQCDRFRQTVENLTQWAKEEKKKEEGAAVSKDFNVDKFSKHLTLLSKVRNSIFHGSREIIASMLDAVESTIEVLSMLNQKSESQALQKDVEAFYKLFSKSQFGQHLAATVANAVYQAAHHCPFFESSAHAFDGSSTVCVPVMRHVLKGYVQAPDGPMCCCLDSLPQEPQRDLKRVINNLLKPLMASIKRVAKFCSLEVHELCRSIVRLDVHDLRKLNKTFCELDIDELIKMIREETIVEKTFWKDCIECGRSILDEFKKYGHPDHCGSVCFSDCENGSILIVQHLIVRKIQQQQQPGYDVACPCVSSIGAIIDDSHSESTATPEVKKRIKTWVEDPAKWTSESRCNRVQLVSAKGDKNSISALLHLFQCDVMRTASPQAGCSLIHPIVVKHSDQAFSQAYVDKFSGKSLVDREKQIADAEAVLRPAAAGNGGIHAAFIYGGPGMGKSQCGEEVLRLLGKFQARDGCMEKVTCRSALADKSEKKSGLVMEKVTCRSALAVKSGLVLLGRRMGKIIGVDMHTPVENVLEALQRLLLSCPYVIMLDDASIDGLEEAFRLLPISNTGTGLLVTSYLIKSKDFHSRLAAKAAGAPTCVEDCECAVLSEDKALQLFQLRGFNVDSEEWFSGVSHELKAMSYHPAAVRQFAEWCHRCLVKNFAQYFDVKRPFSILIDGNTSMFLDSLLANWKSVGRSIMMRNSLDSVCPTYDGMRAAANINLKEMFEDGRPEVVEVAKKLLSMMTLCPPNNTPSQLFFDGWVECNVFFSLQRYWKKIGDDTKVVCDGEVRNLSFSYSDDATREAIDLLQRHALIDYDGEKLEMHQLMSFACRAELGLSETLRCPGEEDLRALQDVRALLTAVFGTVENDKVEDANAYPVMQTVGNTAEYMLERILNMMDPSNVCDSLVPHLRWMCGMFLRLANIQELVACDISRKKNLLLSANSCFEQLVAAQINSVELEDLECRLRLYENEGQVPQLLQLLERYQNSSNSKLRAETLMAIGDAYKGSNHARVEDIVEVYEKAQRIYATLSGPKSVDVATALNNIGEAYWRNDQHNEARRCFYSALEIYVDHFGPEHPWVAVAYHNFGATFQDLQDDKNFDKAMCFFDESLRIKEKTLSSEHFQYAETLSCKGNAYAVRGDYQSALEYHRRALIIFRNVFGCEHRSFKICQDAISKIVGGGH